VTRRHFLRSATKAGLFLPLAPAIVRAQDLQAYQAATAEWNAQIPHLPPPTSYNFLSNSITFSSQSGGNYTVGCTFFCPATTITITALGRWVLSGNSGTHALGLWKVTGGTLLASTSINTSGLSVGWNYVAITGVALTPGAEYAIGSLEASGGDSFGTDTTITSYINSHFTATQVTAVYTAGASLAMPITSALSSGDYGMTCQFTSYA
jgi:hypothetical protein